MTISLVPRDKVYFERCDREMFEAATIPNWVVVIYEGQRRSVQGVVNPMIRKFVEGCKAVGMISSESCTFNGIKDIIGIKINPHPLVKRESVQQPIARVSCLTADLADG